MQFTITIKQPDDLTPDQSRLLRAIMQWEIHDMMQVAELVEYFGYYTFTYDPRLPNGGYIVTDESAGYRSYIWCETVIIGTGIQTFLYDYEGGSEFGPVACAMNGSPKFEKVAEGYRRPAEFNPANLD